ncbi:MAG: 4-hydroxybenzoate octaprenyltransferase [Mariprofundaceae bacterium]|nr:4-hydroxybenzoate octaprenyltransferase [Mariprofundaceae bacterium]
MMIRPLGSWYDWFSLMRVDKPVGYYLLLWPTLWGMLAASHGQPTWLNIGVFVCGVILMRSAGCVINDYADRKFDPHVERTKLRPIAAGNISPKAALFGFFAMLLLAFLLVLQTSLLVIELAFVGAVLAVFYPFMKRYTYFPQAWLGMAFGWGAVMAWAAETGSVLDSPVPWLLFAANICWSLSYDTAYALGDRSDDLKIGVKSTAIWFGERAVIAIISLGCMVILLLGLVAWQYDTAVQIGWLLAALYQSYLCWVLWRCGEPWGFEFFLKSHRVGLLFCLGFLIDAFIAP